MWPVQPTISRLALSSAGYPLFVTGFTLLSTLLVAALVCRAANIDAQLMSRPARVVNRLWLGMAMLSVLFTLLMAFNRADGTLAWVPAWLEAEAAGRRAHVALAEWDSYVTDGYTPEQAWPLEANGQNRLWRAR